MSLEAQMWAFKAQVGDPQAKLVLMVLAARHNPKSGLFPSQVRIAEDSGLSRATVIRKLALLEARGFLRKLPFNQHAGRKRRSLNYLLAIDPGFGSIPGELPLLKNGLTLKQPKSLPARLGNDRSVLPTTVARYDTNPYVESVNSESSPNPPLATQTLAEYRELSAWLATLAFTASSKPTFCDAIVDAIASKGYSVQRDVVVDDRGDGRTGRVDIVVLKDAMPWLAIAVDRTRPTLNSARKLSEFANGLILLRESQSSVESFEGVPVLHFGRRAATLSNPTDARFAEAKRLLQGKDVQ